MAGLGGLARAAQLEVIPVEGCHGVLFTTNCLLLVGKTSPSCLGLSICVSGEFVQGLQRARRAHPLVLTIRDSFP